MKFKIKLIEFVTLLCAGMIWFFIGFVVGCGDFLPVAVMFYSLGIIGGFLTCGMLQAIEDKRKHENKSDD